MNYKQATERNLKHMGTPASQWRAVGIKAMVEIEGDQGKPAMMPTFEFPAGYDPAPSLYRNSGAGEMCCELCAHPIKNAFYIQNDTKRWVLLVGSECVTHFEGASGQQLVKEAIWAENRDLLRQAIALRKAIWNQYRVERHRGYGRYERYIPQAKINDDYQELKKLTVKRQPDPERYVNREVPADSDAVVTRWVNKNGERVKELLATYGELLEVG